MRNDGIPEEGTSQQRYTDSYQQQQNTLHMTAELVPKFSGQDNTYPVNKWIQDVEDTAEIFQWAPLQQLLVARRSLIGTAELWLKSERPFKSWEELKCEISKEFPSTLDAKTVHEIMSARKKKRNESCIDYLLVMKEMGKRGKLADYITIKYIVDGIVDKESNKIMLYGIKTYAELKEKLKIYELVMSKTSEKPQYEQRINSYQQQQRTYQKNSVRCFNCGDLGHSSYSCPNKGKGAKCFKCNDFGHIATACKNSSSGDGARIQIQDGGHRKYLEKYGNRMNDSKRSELQADTSKRSMFGSVDTTANFTSNGGGNVGSTDKSIYANMAGNEQRLITSNVNVTEEVMQVVNKVEKCEKIQCKPVKKVLINKTEVDALIDSGSDVNLVSQNYFSTMFTKKYDDSVILSGLGCSKVMSLGYCVLNLQIDGCNYSDVTFHIVPKDCMPYFVILGQDFLKNAVMIMKEGCVSLFLKDEEWMLKVNCFSCVSDIIGPVSIQTVKDEVIKLVEGYKPQQIKEAPVELKIILKDEKPVVQRPRRLSQKEQDEVDRQVKEWLRDGIIRVSYSDFASPLVLVKKKDDTIRICIDYRNLNKKIVRDEYPLPIVDDLIDKLANAKVYSALDLRNGYFHLNISEESRKYTAFVTQTGQYEFLKAPFGLATCPKVFMRFITSIFRNFIASGIIIIFMDDLLIPAINEEQAVERLRLVLQRASEYGLNINWKKSQLLVKTVEYLGHVIQEGTVMPSPEKTKSVLNFPEPKNIKQLHSFLGLCSYFRKFIQNYAQIAQPLTDLLRKDKAFNFDDEQRTVFNMLKQCLASAPVLKIYNPRAETELHTDASSVAYSAILMQRCEEDGELHPVHYMSRRTNDAQSKYTSYELEALAIIEAVKKFRHYLHGISFKIVTDCKAFMLTLNKQDLAMSTRVARWILLLQDYNFTIEHRSGTKMRHVDALSRNPYVSVITSDLHRQLQQAQENDDGLRAIMEILKEGKSYEDYYLYQKLLCRGEEQSLVVPKKMEDYIIRKAHENGHFAKKKTIELISKQYYIENLEKKVADVLASCVPCILGSRKEGKREGFLHTISKEDGPLHTLHVDHIGPLAETKKKYNYILTIVDGFTKFVWVFPVKTVTAKETLEKIEILQQTFGNPVRFVSDRGTAFTSKEFEEYCSSEGIQHVKITTGVPRGNGQVERIHRTIISVLTKLNIEEPANWYKHTSKLQKALNSTYQRSIKTTPFELLTGVKMRQKEDLELIQMLEEEYVSTFMTQREEARNRAKEQILKIQEENTRNYNRKRKPSTEYKIGSLVAIKRTQFGTAMKLKAKYLGPYKVIGIKGKDRYEVERISDSGEGSKRTTTCAEFMKKWSDKD